MRVSVQKSVQLPFSVSLLLLLVREEAQRVQIRTHSNVFGRSSLRMSAMSLFIGGKSGAWNCVCTEKFECTSAIRLQM